MEKGGTAGTNHPGIIDYKGKTYLTYHSGTLAGGGDYARSECIEDLVWNVDGTIPRIERTDAGCKQLEAFNPYARNEAETICWGNGVKTESCSAGGLNVCDIQNGEYIKVAGVDFGTGAASFKVSATSATNGGTLTLHLDKQDDAVIGKCTISKTGGWQMWQEFSCDISGAEGVHDLYFTFEGSGWALFNMDWWQFSGNQVLQNTVIKGDVNGDSVIDIFDLGLAKQAILKGDSSLTADVDGNGKAEVTDIILLTKWLHHQITAFPQTEIPTEPVTEALVITVSPKEYMQNVEKKIVNSEPQDATAEKSNVTYGTYKKETIQSEVCKRKKSFNVLIPANYDTNKKYPVLYVLHGYWGDENALLDKGDASLRLRQIIGNAIASGEAEDMIVVFPDIYASATQDKCDGLNDKNNAAYDNFINLLTKEIMPYMEQHYSIKTGRENTAITGFSMGGRESLYIGLTHPEMFGYIGAMCPAPGVPLSENQFKFSDTEPYLFLVSAGSNDTLIYNTPEGYHNTLTKNNTTHIWHYVNGGDHGGKTIRPHVYNFVRYIFKADK